MKKWISGFLNYIYAWPQGFDSVWIFARGGLHPFRNCSDWYVKYYATKPLEWRSKIPMREKYCFLAEQELNLREQIKCQQTKA